MALIECEECGSEVSSKAESCPKCGIPLKAPKGSQNLGCGTVIVALFLIGIFVSELMPDDSTRSIGSSSPAIAPPPNPKNVALANLEIKNLRWTKAGFDNLMQVTVTFMNNGKVDVKDVELTCDHFSNSGTHIDSNTRVIYEVIQAGKSRTFKDFDMGFIHSQAIKTRCSVTDLALK